QRTLTSRARAPTVPRMSIVIRKWSANEVEPLRALASHPSLRREFELLQGHGLEERLADAYNREGLRRLASLDGRDVGFAYTFLFPTRDGVHAGTRGGVIEPARRRGVGRAMIEESIEAVRRLSPECHAMSMAATLPNEDAGSFANRMGFAPVRR